MAEVARQFAHAAVADNLHEHDFTALVLGLATWAEAGANQPSTLGDHPMGKPLCTLAPSLLNRAAGKVKRRSRHAGQLSVAKRHALRKSLRKLCFDVESLAGLYRPRAVKIYSSRCEEVEKSLAWPTTRWLRSGWLCRWPAPTGLTWQNQQALWFAGMSGAAAKPCWVSSPR